MSELASLVIGSGFTYGFMAFFICYFMGYVLRVLYNIALGI